MLLYSTFYFAYFFTDKLLSSDNDLSYFISYKMIHLSFNTI